MTMLVAEAFLSRLIHTLGHLYNKRISYGDVAFTTGFLPVLLSGTNKESQEN